MLDAEQRPKTCGARPPNLRASKSVVNTWYEMLCLCSRSALSTRGSSSPSRIEWSRVTQPSGASSRANLGRETQRKITNIYWVKARAKLRFVCARARACLRAWQKRSKSARPAWALTSLTCCVVCWKEKCVVVAFSRGV